MSKGMAVSDARKRYEACTHPAAHIRDGEHFPRCRSCNAHLPVTVSTSRVVKLGTVSVQRDVEMERE